jgi:hypothetical protein
MYDFQQVFMTFAMVIIRGASTRKILLRSLSLNNKLRRDSASKGENF